MPRDALEGITAANGPTFSTEKPKDVLPGLRAVQTVTSTTMLAAMVAAVVCGLSDFENGTGS